ncbi:MULTISPECIES: LysR family transcriptional regulator [Pseudonocardia]|uniref:Hca operon transcriptional activator n=2 Tax=Pseudonocardia TaxID=1847 RepID=A0A1Y2MZZ1_PSEAH|nr:MULTISPECIES: LysR family transcriptional regulator [Pseudonocardia]OSY40740.1 Hca operon transcriptional activator [Pseudonocardia autotrophica]TDN71953.1 DNA-binding transcriptional LysR family regulator [Pseudonocardia autotrophica]BBG02640.1 putative transcriptional regulator, LysR family protein [Pseudonocardia autotrophica]GEC24699.1 putative transcriptional regulator, LysR family protein [Pseudonocardia saturnea]
MDVRLLELFVCVAEEGSIHGGARRLRIAQPAVSKGLRRLERHVGTELAHRSAHGVELTPAGALLLIEARELLERIGRITDAVRDTALRERRITLGLIAGTVSAAELTRQIVDVYRRRHPGLIVSLRELTFPEQFTAVESGEVDVALVRPPYVDDELAVEPLFDEPLVLCCGADHPLAEAHELTVAEVLDEPMPDMPAATRDWTDFWHLTDSRGGPARIGGDPAGTLSELCLAVDLGGVVTPAAASAWRMGLERPSLRAVPLSDAPRSQVAVASRRRDQRSDVLGFAECARDVARAMIDDVDGATLLVR